MAHNTWCTGPFGLVFLFTALTPITGGDPERSKTPSDRHWPSFLEEFMSRKATPTINCAVAFHSAVGRVHGYFARPAGTERLPAVLLLHDEHGLTEWMKKNARDLAGVGYVALALDLSQQRSPSSEKMRGAAAVDADETTLAKLSAAVRWLRRHADVLPECVGVVGWSCGGEQALALAAATPLQACVVCDAPVTNDAALVAGLRGTSVLIVVPGHETGIMKTVPPFDKALAGAHVVHKVCVYTSVQSGFMGPQDGKDLVQAAADRAWFEIYEFLGKYVEDANLNPVIGSAEGPIVAGSHLTTIADIMRAVNEPTGVRGTLLRALEQPPGTQRQWDRVRANAALMADAASLLLADLPPRGARRQWREQVTIFQDAIKGIVAAADRHDYAQARKGLDAAAARCSACHEHHR